MTPDEEFCSVCIHRSKIWGKVGCMYLKDTGDPRGCPPGERCTKREIGDQINRSKPYSCLDPEVKKKQREENAKRTEMIGYKGDALRRMRVKE